MEVKYVPYGIANNFGTHIELNENLPKYPNLHAPILAHELSHTQEKGFTKEDLLVDIRPVKLSYSELLKFMIKYPKTMVQFLPFYISNNTFIYDINMCITWGLTLAITGLGLYLIF